MKRTLLCLILLLVFAPASLASGASLPKPDTNLIVVPTSIGGIKVNTPEGRAKAAWGDRGKCTDYGYSGRCEYGSSQTSSGYATIGFFKHKVSSVNVVAGSNAKGEQLTTAALALSSLRTSGGAGLGTKFSKLKSSYPQGERRGSPSNGVFYWIVKGDGKKAMTFTLLGSSKKVFQITLSNGMES